MSSTAKAFFALTAVFVAAIALWDTPAPAQIPDKFTNLKVLPKDIGKRDLLNTMHEMTSGLDVRCDYCHAESAKNPDDLDFASDEKDEKRTARVMLQMVGEINGTLIPKAGLDSPTKVQCVTCHHGVTKPQTLSHLLLGVMEKDGYDAMEAKYRDLRNQYYGSASYDFSAGSLGDLAETLVRDKQDADGAIKVMQLDLEFYPDDAQSHLLLGQIYARKGDTENAVASIKRCLELDPGNRWAERALKQIQGGTGGDK